MLNSSFQKKLTNSLIATNEFSARLRITVGVIGLRDLRFRGTQPTFARVFQVTSRLSEVIEALLARVEPLHCIDRKQVSDI